MRSLHESPDLISMTSHVLTLISQKVECFCCLLKHFEASLTNSEDPDQTAPIWVHTVCFYTYVKQ